MEMETEEHMFYTEYNDDCILNVSNQSLNPDDQLPFLNQQNPMSVMHPENEKSLLNPEHQISLQNAENQIVQENQNLSINHDADKQTTSHSEEIQQSLYKLDNIDTKALIKTDIKQLLLAKISEEINSKALNDMRYEAQQQISSLRNRAHTLENKNQDLDGQVKSDESRLKQLETTLLKTDEMITLLKENIEKLAVRYRELHINDILERGAKQNENLQHVKKSFMAKLKTEKECLKDVEGSGLQRNDALKKELTQKREVLNKLKNEIVEVKRNVAFREDEIEKNLAKKQKLEKKLSAMMNQTTVMEQEFVQEKKLLSELVSKKEAQTTRFDELSKEKAAMEQKLCNILQESDTTNANLLCIEDQIVEKQEAIATLENLFATVKDEFQENLKKLQTDHDTISTQLTQVKTELLTNIENNNRLINEQNKLSATYIAKCDEKVALIRKNLEHQNSVRDANLNKLKQQLQNDVERVKLEELRKQYEVSVAQLDSLEKSITKEKHDTSNELLETRLAFEAMQTEYSTCFLEMEERKQYLIENSKFLEEKEANLHHDVTELEQSIKSLEEENKSVELMIQQKSSLLNENKHKLILSRKTQESEVVLKSTLKSPNTEKITKKVKFNEILSFKSPTSSDISNIPGEPITQLETSFREWLEESTEKTEQEF